MTTLDLAAPVLQPGSGAIDADHYLPTRVDQLFWGRLPCATDAPVLSVASGQSVTVDGGYTAQ